MAMHTWTGQYRVGRLNNRATTIVFWTILCTPTPRAANLTRAGASPQTLPVAILNAPSRRQSIIQGSEGVKDLDLAKAFVLPFA